MIYFSLKVSRIMSILGDNRVRLAVQGRVLLSTCRLLAATLATLRRKVRRGCVKSSGRRSQLKHSLTGWEGFPLLLVLALGCQKPDPKRNAVPIAGPTTMPASPTASSAPAASTAANLSDLRRLFALSEAGDRFISDNVVSNETSLLQPATALTALHGGVYIGVGPEQNFTYIALSRPEFAFIVDLRRDNALLHLLYKSLFEIATSRLEFVCLLFGRPYDPKYEPGPDANADAVLQAMQRIAPNRDWFDKQHARSSEGLQGYGLGLSTADIARIKKIHELFFVRQLDLRFELHKANGRKYPSIGSLLRLRSPSGLGTFLNRRDSFAFVQQLHRQHRIVPLVGDVSAPGTLGTVAEELRRRGLTLRTFYISNVEQYLMGQPSFTGWLNNLRRLPHDEHSLLLRCYLDQGRPHPHQQPGQRSTSLAHRLNAFLESTPLSYFDIVTDDSLLVTGSANLDGG